MKILIFFILNVIFLLGISSCFFGKKVNDSPTELAKKLENPNAIEFLLKVGGLDSSNVEGVQNRLAEENGIIKNFACYSDSNIFIKFDTTLIQKAEILQIIRDFGFQVSEMDDNSEDL